MIISKMKSNIVKYNEDYLKMQERAKRLLEALQDYDKKTINKTFFEKYFTSINENGEIRTNWKNEIITDFQFSDPSFSWETYKKRIYLYNNEYINVNSTDKDEVIRATVQTIEKIQAWINNNNEKLADLEAINEDDLINHIMTIKEKYNAKIVWAEILDYCKYN